MDGLNRKHCASEERKPRFVGIFHMGYLNAVFVSIHRGHGNKMDSFGSLPDNYSSSTLYAGIAHSASIAVRIHTEKFSNV